jgi:Lar family restriction alleviation protein
MTQSLSRNELLPCPFCGRTDLLGVEPKTESGFLAVRCRACGTHGPARTAESDDEAIALWNSRASLPSESVPITYGQIVKDARAIVGISDDKQGEWDREGQAELLREFAEVIQKDRPDSAIPDAMRSIADTLAASPSDKVDAAYVIQKLRQRSDAYHHERHSGFYSNGDAALDSEAALLLEQLTKSAGLRSAESYECQIKAQHQVIAERDATIASLRSHEQQSAVSAIEEHNKGCLEACGKTSSYPHVRESRRCDSRRDCPDCPKDWLIEWPSNSDSGNARSSDIGER